MEKERANVSTTKCQHLKNIKPACRERKKERGSFHQRNDQDDKKTEEVIDD